MHVDDYVNKDKAKDKMNMKDKLSNSGGRR
jgi:hypothetical protein